MTTSLATSVTTLVTSTMSTTGRGGVLSLGDDGTWRESDSELWQLAPLYTWSDGQNGAEGLFRLNPVVVGYELLGDRPTVHLRSGEAPADVWADMWLDTTGVALRVVYDVSFPGEQDQMWLVWDVQDIGPETDLGPFPPILSRGHWRSTVRPQSSR